MQIPSVEQIVDYLRKNLPGHEEGCHGEGYCTVARDAVSATSGISTNNYRALIALGKLAEAEQNAKSASEALAATRALLDELDPPDLLVEALEKTKDSSPKDVARYLRDKGLAK